MGFISLRAKKKLMFFGHWKVLAVLFILQNPHGVFLPTQETSTPLGPSTPPGTAMSACAPQLPSVTIFQVKVGDVARNNVDPKKGPFLIGKACLPTTIFSGDILVFRGGGGWGWVTPWFKKRALTIFLISHNLKNWSYQLFQWKCWVPSNMGGGWGVNEHR